MYNFCVSFQKIKFKDWIFLRFNMEFWIRADKDPTALVHENFSQPMKFLWTIKGNKKKKLFSQAVFFYILFYWFVLQIILLYTITTHRWTIYITAVEINLTLTGFEPQFLLSKGGGDTQTATWHYILTAKLNATQSIPETAFRGRAASHPEERVRPCTE